MNIASRISFGLRVAPLLVGSVLAGAGCESDAVVRPSAIRVQAVDTHVVLLRTSRTDDVNGNIVGAMGATLTNAAKVRVVNADGVAQAGIVVHFSIVRGNATIEHETTTTDALGEADGGALAVGVADSVELRAQLRISVDDPRNAAELVLDIVAQRDLAHFGGSLPARFDVLPIDRAQLTDILPLGTMANADAALPSADALLVPRGWRNGNRSESVAVRAMSDGLVIAIDSTRRAITMRVRDAAIVRYAGIVMRGDVWVGRAVHAGDELGVMDSHTELAGLAVRVLDGAVDHRGWVRPERYGMLRNSAFFARYLVDSLRSDAFALVRRAAPDLDGRIDYDRAGRVIGSWFDEQAPLVSTDVDPSAALAPRAITFAYDAERPGQVRVAIGRELAGRLGIAGVYAVAWEDSDPALIGAEQGAVTYRLFATNDDSRMGRGEGVLVLQLTDDALYLGYVRDGSLPRLTSASLRLTR